MRIADINTKKEKAAEEQKRWDKLLRDIESSLLNEEWMKLVNLCREALEIHENAEVRSKLNKAKGKLAEIQKNEQFNKIMSEINELAVRKEFDEANSKLNSLERSLKKEGLLDNVKEKAIRDKRKSLFDFGLSSEAKSNNQNIPYERTRVTGFSDGSQKKPTRKSEPPKINDSDFDDWDFGSLTKEISSAATSSKDSETKI